MTPAINNQSICCNTCLEAFRHGIAPELFHLSNFVKHGVNDNEAEIAVINLSLEALEETHLV